MKASGSEHRSQGCNVRVDDLWSSLERIKGEAIPALSATPGQSWATLPWEEGPRRSRITGAGQDKPEGKCKAEDWRKKERHREGNSPACLVDPHKNLNLGISSSHEQLI